MFVRDMFQKPIDREQKFGYSIYYSTEQCNIATDSCEKKEGICEKKRIA